MTTTSELLIDAYGRIAEVTRRAVEDLTPEQLAIRLDADANSIAWLVWHLARVQDDHVAGVSGDTQVWLTGDWQERFGLPFAPEVIGYGQSSTEVAAVGVVSGELLLGYLDAVTAQSLAYLATLTDGDLDRVVDTRWTPEVTLAVRLVSVIGDDLQHAGQAAFIAGIVRRSAAH